MKITFLIQDLFQQGAQYVTALMVRGFISKGYSVDLILSKVHADLLAKNDIKPFEVPESTNVIILKDRKARNNIREIRFYLKQTDSKAIIAMSPNYATALALASIGLHKRPKIAYVEHSSYAGINPQTGRDLSVPRFFSIATLRSWLVDRRFDTVMAVSKGTAKGVERTGRLKEGVVKVVYNPVVDAEYQRKLSQESRHPWLLNKIQPTIVAAGAHCTFKNHYVLFEAIKIVNTITPVRLILFGKGDLTESYKAWIATNNMQDKIMLSGHTSNLPAELKNADIFVISSNVESFSVVLVEALAAGVPIISTKCPYGPPELLHNGEYGTLVPTNDPKAMAQAIIDQLQNPRQAAPRESWEPYLLDNVVESYERALHL